MRKPTIREQFWYYLYKAAFKLKILRLYQGFDEDFYNVPYFTTRWIWQRKDGLERT